MGLRRQKIDRVKNEYRSGRLYSKLNQRVSKLLVILVVKKYGEVAIPQ